ncbi:hypothetical protein SEUCBS139899_003547 [Sporothrix eucalyptigena]|uniref:Fe2OG dioxygenase domain-containing protein n=1 Tax=Sporothrix eucalyptigena TaxID=1812306 RepID=A0ABP0B735_9PEZI
MPPTLPIDLANFPALRTRKALLVLDLQNEFLSPNAALPVSTPDGYVDRILQVAKKFRDSGSGDVFWIRSQFDSHRPAASSQIITSATTQILGTPGTRLSAPRGRRRESEPPVDDQDADPEAFLSATNTSQKEQEQQQLRSQSLLPGSHGSELAPSVAASVNARQDLVIAKSHYSAFESTQLLNRLRTRFVTELYICGALTNVSIYATALDAARHGLTLTIIEDCCGYRDITRHNNAITSLVQLTGCDTLSAELVLDSMTSPSSDEPSPANDFAAAIAAITAASSGPPRVRRSTKQATAGPIAVGGSPGTSGGNSGGLPVRTKNPEPSEDDKQSDDARTPSVPSSREKPALSRSSPTAKVLPEAEPETVQPVQPVVAKESATAMTTKNTMKTTSATVTIPVAAAVAAGPKTGFGANAGAGTATPATPKASAPTTITAKPSSRQTPAPIEPVKIDLGEITPDEDSNEDDNPDESFEVKIPSRHEKLLEYSRLRSSRNAELLKKRLEDAAKESAAIRATKQQHGKAPLKPDVAPAESKPSYPASSTKAMGTSSSPMAEKAASPVSPPGPQSAVTSKAIKVTDIDVKGLAEQDPKTEADSDDLEADAELVLVDKTKEPTATAPICAGDTIIYHDVLPQSLENGIYERLKDEVQWLRMSHQGGEVPRLVCVQGDVDKDGSIPIYRHPADESPPLEAFTPTVLEIKKEVEKVVGHPLNHALIQLYRTGNDYISEHSDKTLDIVPSSYVCNMSLGAERTMIFRTKRVDKDPSHKEESSSSGDAAPAAAGEGAKRQSCRVQLPHNSLCRMGLQTNMKWLHAIRQDKRISREKTPAELAYGGGRISLTFRQIGTFLNADQSLIWGQGAVGKTHKDARPVINGQSDKTIKMLQAFGTENHSSSFDWEKHYGKGFDVLHMSSSPRFFSSSDAVVNMSIQLFLADLGISYAKGSMSAPTNKKDTVAPSSDEAETDAVPSVSEALSSLDISVRLVDNDRDRSVVQGVLAILLYLDAVYSPQPTGQSAQHHLETARKYTRLQQALQVQDRWRSVSSSTEISVSDTTTFSLRPLKSDLILWDSYIPPASDGAKDVGATFIAGGSSPSVVDFAFWAVLYSMETSLGGQDTLASELQCLGAGNLAKYYTAFKARDFVTKFLTVGEI